MAQQHLFVTQQSMSEQKRLEQLYCAKLFTRRPRFQLTAPEEAAGHNSNLWNKG